MKDLLDFIFSDFWHFAGFIFILMIICGSPVVSINHYYHDKDEDNDV